MDKETARRVTAAFVLAFTAVSCGYNAGFKMPEGMEKIHVRIFKNRTFYRKLDVEFTQLVKQEILARTDLSVVREKKADLILSCSVDRVRKSVLQEDENDLPQEVEYTLLISASAKDRFGKVVFAETGLQRSVRYVLSVGETEATARRKALREVSRELVYRMAEKLSWSRKKTKKDKD